MDAVKCMDKMNNPQLSELESGRIHCSESSKRGGLWININDKEGKLDYQKVSKEPELKNQSVAKNWSFNLLLKFKPSRNYKRLA